MKTYQCPECKTIYTISEPPAGVSFVFICDRDDQILVPVAEQPPALGISVTETIVAKDKPGDG